MKGGRYPSMARMYGPAVCCKRLSPGWGGWSCANVSGLELELVLRTIMESARVRSHYARCLEWAKRAISARMRREDHRSIPFFLSQT
jgi:hypothetical protein